MANCSGKNSKFVQAFLGGALYNFRFHENGKLCATFTAGVVNAIRGVFKLDFHLLGNIIVNCRDDIREDVVLVFPPPRAIVEHLQWVLHERHYGAWKDRRKNSTTTQSS